VMPEIETRENARDREERQRKTSVNMLGKPDGHEEEEGTFFFFFSCCYMHVTNNIKILT
jgi:hypothetical protein